MLVRLFEFVPSQRAWTLCGDAADGGQMPQARLSFVEDPVALGGGGGMRLVVADTTSGKVLTDHAVTADARLEPSVSGEQAWVFLVHNDAVTSPIPSHLREGSSGDRVFAVHFTSAGEAARFAEQHGAACVLASESLAAASGVGADARAGTGAGASSGCEIPRTLQGAAAWLRQRSPNQDTFAVSNAGSGRTASAAAVYAVFDGHGPHGSRVAESLQRRVVGDARSSCCEQHAACVGPALRSLLEAAQRRVEHEFGSALGESGASALIAITRGATLTVAHTGACRLLLVSAADGGGVASPSVTSLTAAHSPADAAERRRIEASGGVVAAMDPVNTAAHPRRAVQLGEVLGAEGSATAARVWCRGVSGPGLPLSRSIGDLTAHRRCGVVATPGITQRTLADSDRFLVLLSAGECGALLLLWAGAFSLSLSLSLSLIRATFNPPPPLLCRRRPNAIRPRGGDERNKSSRRVAHDATA